MSKNVESEYQQTVLEDVPPPTGYIAIGLRQTDRGLRLVRLFTTDTLPREFQDEAPTVN